MLVLGEDRIVGLEIVLFQERLSVSDLHIKEGVTHTENLVRHGDGERGWSARTSTESKLRGFEVVERDNLASLARVVNQAHASIAAAAS